MDEAWIRSYSWPYPVLGAMVSRTPRTIIFALIAGLFSISVDVHGHSDPDRVGTHVARGASLGCGVNHVEGDPGANAGYVRNELEVVPVRYVSDPSEDFSLDFGEAATRLSEWQGERLRAGTSRGSVFGQRVRALASPDCSAAYLSVADASVCGTTQNVRVALEWGIVHDRIDPFRCSVAGTQMTETGVRSGQYICTEDQIATDEKISVIETFLAWATAQVGAIFEIKPVVGGIAVSTGALSGLNLRSLPTLGPFDADIVIYVTLRPETTDSVAGYAYCVQRDQYNRCTVGVINICPNIVNVASAESPPVVEAMRRTSLHEIFHIMDAVSCIAPLNDDGSTGSVASVCVPRLDTAFEDRKVYDIVVPTVLEIAREHYGCDTISGMPLEDFPVGAGSHWEARLMGPELMSYGGGTGEGYISELTLAMIEGIGHYKANYSIGGRIVDNTAKELEAHPFTALAKDAYEESKPEVVEFGTDPSRPGAMRWGKAQGCDFFYGRPDEWTESVFPLLVTDTDKMRRYICEEPNSYGCTYDNSMQAACVVEEWSAASRIGPRTASEYVGKNSDGSIDQGSITNDQYPYLPTMFQYEGINGQSLGADPALYGGTNGAMDYVPYRYGFWNCKDSLAMASSDIVPEGGVSPSLGASWSSGGSKSVEVNSGQEHCPECRCFLSSLTDFSQFLTNPTLSRFGLCYPSNCFMKNHLQIGIMKAFGIYWYKCPPQGGRMYIPGFVGAVHCPEAENFCKMERITGIKHSETDVWREFVLYISGLFFIPLGLLLMISCIFRCGRENWILLTMGDGHLLSRLNYALPKDRERAEVHWLIKMFSDDGPQRRRRAVSVVLLLGVCGGCGVTGLTCFSTIWVAKEGIVVWNLSWALIGITFCGLISFILAIGMRISRFWTIITCNWFLIISFVYLTSSCYILLNSTIEPELCAATGYLLSILLFALGIALVLVIESIGLYAILETFAFISNVLIFCNGVVVIYGGFAINYRITADAEVTAQSVTEEDERRLWYCFVMIGVGAAAAIGSVLETSGIARILVRIPRSTARKNDALGNKYQSDRFAKALFQVYVMIGEGEKAQGAHEHHDQHRRLIVNLMADKVTNIVAGSFSQRIMHFVYVVVLFFNSLGCLFLTYLMFSWALDIDREDEYRLGGGTGLIFRGIYVTPFEAIVIYRNAALLLAIGCFATSLTAGLRWRRVALAERVLDADLEERKKRRLARKREKRQANVIVSEEEVAPVIV